MHGLTLVLFAGVLTTFVQGDGNGLDVSLGVRWKRHELAPIMEVSEFVEADDFWKVVDHVVMKSPLTGKEEALKVVDEVTADLFGGKETLEHRLAQMSVDLRENAPAIEQQIQLGNAFLVQIENETPQGFEAWVALGHACGDRTLVKSTKDLKTTIESFSKVTCSEKAFPSIKNAMTLLDHDHVHPNSKLDSDVTVILHGVLGTSSFGKMHKTLAEALETKESEFTYAIRYWVHNDDPFVSSENTTLQGYGVSMDIKNMEYLTVDDDGKSDTFKTGSESEIEQIKTTDMADLGYQAAFEILANDDPLKKWMDLSHNFPLRAKTLIDVEVPKIFREAASLLERQVPESGIFTVNGIAFDVHSESFNLFGMLSKLKGEARLLRQASSFKEVGDIDGAHMVTSVANAEGSTLERNSPDSPNESVTSILQASGKRVDVQLDAKGAVIFLNNLEKDRVYQSWPPDLLQLLQPVYQLIPVRKNLYTVILTINPASSSDRIALATSFFYLGQGAPIRFGVVFSDQDDQIQDNVCASECFVSLFHAAIDIGKKAMGIQLIAQLAQYRGELDIEAAVSTFVALCTRMSQSTSNTECSEQAMAALQEKKGKKTLVKMHDYVSSKGLAVPSWTLNGIVYPKLASLQSELQQEVFSEQRRLAFLVKQGAITGSTNILKYILEESKAITRYNAQMLLSTSESNFITIPESSSERLGDITYIWDGGETWQEENIAPVTIWMTVSKDSKAGGPLKAMLKYAESQPSGVRIAILPGSREAVEQFPNFWQNLGSSSMSAIIGSLDETGKSDGLEGLEKWLSLTEHISTWLPSREISIIMCNGRVLDLPVQFELLNTDIELLVSHEREMRGNVLREYLVNLGHRITFTLAMSISPIVGLYNKVERQKLDISEFSKQFGPLMTEIDSLNGSPELSVNIIVDPLSESAPRIAAVANLIHKRLDAKLSIVLVPHGSLEKFPLSSFYTFVAETRDTNSRASFRNLPQSQLLTLKLSTPESWITFPIDTDGLDTDNIRLGQETSTRHVSFELKAMLITGHCEDVTTSSPPAGLQLLLRNPLSSQDPTVDTLVMRNLGYFQLQANPGIWYLQLAEGPSKDLFQIESINKIDSLRSLRTMKSNKGLDSAGIEGVSLVIRDFTGEVEQLLVRRRPGKENEELLDSLEDLGTADMKAEKSTVQNSDHSMGEKASEWLTTIQNYIFGNANEEKEDGDQKEEIVVSHSMGSDAKSSNDDTIHVFSLASGALYERFIRIMMVSVTKQTKSPVKFWLIENFLSPTFKNSIAELAEHYGFEYALVTYRWPHWLRRQSEKQRIIWGYKILFLDVLFPLSVPRIIFIDSDQVVRADIKELWDMDLQGKPYGYTPFCDSRKETLGFQFWRSGYWESHLKGRPYHISALYVVDLKLFRRGMVGDKLRAVYDQLSRDPGSLSNLDQDLPNYAQYMVPIHSLPQEWLWCESWCSDESKAKAKTIDLCNNPLHKEPKIDMAKRIIAGDLFPQSWMELDNEIKQFLDHHSSSTTSVPILEPTIEEKQEL